MFARTRRNGESCNAVDRPSGSDCPGQGVLQQPVARDVVIYLFPAESSGVKSKKELEWVDRELRGSSIYELKRYLDGVLPVVLLLIPVVLYLEFFATEMTPLYAYKSSLNTAILSYFVTELVASFLLYEERKNFFRERWVDILLTLPFFTVFKGVSGVLRLAVGLKPAKILKASKIPKTLKLTKLGQKVGKLYTKGKKTLEKKFG